METKTPEPSNGNGRRLPSLRNEMSTGSIINLLVLICMVVGMIVTGVWTIGDMRADIASLKADVSHIIVDLRVLQDAKAKGP